MSNRASSERQIREIVIAANSGEATDDQIKQLDNLIRDNPELAAYAASLLDQQAALAWQGSSGERSPNILPLPVTTTAGERSVRREERVAKARWMSSAFAWPAIAVGIAFLLGAFVADWIQDGAPPAQSQSPQGVADVRQPSSDGGYEARLVGSTACLWDSNSVGSREIGSWLTSGESLHLLEGLAEFKLQWSRGGNATLSLEGPAAMMLTSEGMPMLRFGRLAATINASSRPFVLDTPVGRLVVEEFGSIGASAFGNDGEIHVFDGSATLEPAWQTLSSQQNVPLEIKAGEAIHVQEGANGELSITRHPADKEYFVAQLSMNSDALIIPPAYVAAVKKSAPLGYWRFERDVWPRAINQMGDGFECRVEGALGVAAYHGNQAVEFGVTDQGGEIICNDLINDQIKDSYSIEFWIKPSHYHVGSVISLIGDPDTPNGIIPHGFLLELGGTGMIPTAVHHPGRIRFLHRSPASNDSDTGTSCYSTDAYTLRKWQHVVAQKDGKQMRLFFNGELAGEGEDATELPPGMRLLLGRLYPQRRVRPFIGQLDELAIYSRALAPEEIKQHYQIVRPKVARETGI